MEKVQPFHDTFTLDRHIKASPAKVFDAFRNPELKSKWFVGPAGYEVAERSIDFRIGGREILRGKFPDGKTTSYDATFYDIVDGQRIVYAYDLVINGKRFSVTLATVEFRESAGGTRLLFTEQNTYIHAPTDAHTSRQQGVNFHIDNLVELL
nr:Activator of Hsp90 ATPase homolog 1-like protein [uncultured bacterium]